MSPIQTILGFWRTAPSASASASSSSDVDLEAQTQRATTTIVTGTHSPLPFPAPAHTYAPTARNTNPVDDFFGVSRTVRDSRHDDVRLPTPIEAELPPAYARSHWEDEEECLPAYDAPLADPTTLAQYLFRFGFLFFPFWILGALILLSPLSAPADFHPLKPEAERQVLVRLMRAAELKWAKRCAFALLALAVCVGAVVGVVEGVLRNGIGA